MTLASKSHRWLSQHDRISNAGKMQLVKFAELCWDVLTQLLEHKLAAPMCLMRLLTQ